MITFLIVTPSFNSEAFIAETLVSVLQQRGNFRVRYHVQDGGSRDRTVPLLERMLAPTHLECLGVDAERCSVSFASERDSGMYEAINRGFVRLLSQGGLDPHATVMTWINSDDVLQPGALQVVTEVLETHGDVDFLTGRLGIMAESGGVIRINEVPDISQPLLEAGLHDGRNFGLVNQEGTFWRLGLWHGVGGLDPAFRVAGDWDLWRRLGRLAPLVAVDSVLACHRRREGQLSADLTRYFSELDGALTASDHEERSSALKQYAALLEARDLFRLSRHSTTRIHYNFERKAWLKTGQSVLPLLPAELRSGQRTEVGCTVAVAAGTGPPIGPFPEWNLPAGVRWVTDDLVQAGVERDVAAPATFKVTLRVYAAGLRCAIRHNGVEVASHALRPYGNDREIELLAPLRLAAGHNSLQLSFSGAGARHYAILVVQMGAWLVERAAVSRPRLLQEAGAETAPPATPEEAPAGFATSVWILGRDAGAVAATAESAAACLPPGSPLIWLAPPGSVGEPEGILRVEFDESDAAAALSTLREVAAANAGYLRILRSGDRLVASCPGPGDRPAATAPDAICHPVVDAAAGSEAACRRVGDPLAALARSSPQEKLALLLDSADVSWHAARVALALSDTGRPSGAPGQVALWHGGALALDGGQDPPAALPTGSARLCILGEGRGGPALLQAPAYARLGEALRSLAAEVNLVTLPEGAFDRGDEVGDDPLAALPEELSAEAYDAVLLVTDRTEGHEGLEHFAAQLECPAVLVAPAAADPWGGAYELRWCGALATERPPLDPAPLFLDSPLLQLLPSRAQVRQLLGIGPDELVLLATPGAARSGSRNGALTRLVGCCLRAEPHRSPHLLVSAERRLNLEQTLARVSVVGLRNALERLSWCLAADLLVVDTAEEEATGERAIARLLLDSAQASALPILDLAGEDADARLRNAMTPEQRDAAIGARRQALSLGQCRARLGLCLGPLLLPDGGSLLLREQAAPLTAESYVIETGVRRLQPAFWNFRVGPGLFRSVGQSGQAWRVGPAGGAIVIQPPEGTARRIRLSFQADGETRLEVFTFLIDEQVIDERRLQLGGDIDTFNIDLPVSVEGAFTLVLLRGGPGVEGTDPAIAGELVLKSVKTFGYDVAGGLSLLSGSRASRILGGLPPDGHFFLVSGGTMASRGPRGVRAFGYSVHDFTARLRVFSKHEGLRLMRLAMLPQREGLVTVTFYGTELGTKRLWAGGRRVELDIAPYLHIGYSDIEIGFEPFDTADGEAAEDTLYRLLDLRFTAANGTGGESPPAPARDGEAIVLPFAEALPPRVDWSRSQGLSDPHTAQRFLRAGFRWMVGGTCAVRLRNCRGRVDLILVYRSIIPQQRIELLVDGRRIYEGTLTLTLLEARDYVRISFVCQKDECDLEIRAEAVTRSADGAQDLALLIEDLEVLQH